MKELINRTFLVEPDVLIEGLKLPDGEINGCELAPDGKVIISVGVVTE